MQFHVLYEAGSIDYFGSNVDYWDFTCYKPSWLSRTPGVQHLIWQLNDLPLTVKWASVYKNKMQRIFNTRRTKKPFKFTTVYDVYMHPTEERILESYRVMNQQIDYINNCAYTKNCINTNLKLNENNLAWAETDKLNRLHEDFETIMKDLTDRRNAKELSIPEEEWKALWLALQSINLIVHYNEKITGSIPSYLAKVEPFYFTALKWEETANSEVRLEPEDYRDFTLEENPGDLWLDFGTVGKDLFHCFCTNDLELVQQQMVSAQWELKPWVSYLWSRRTASDAQKFAGEYFKWIQENNLSQYIDINDPKYTPGRHRLGNCISHDFSNSQEFYDTIISKTPKIKCYYLTDDDGNSIYETD